MTSTGWYFAGIQTSSGSLTLDGAGSLTVTGGYLTAGTGTWSRALGDTYTNITIKNLTVKATGGDGGADIGTGINGMLDAIVKVGTVHIYNADVTAIGKYSDYYSLGGAAAIGCGIIATAKSTTLQKKGVFNYG